MFVCVTFLSVLNSTFIFNFHVTDVHSHVFNNKRTSTVGWETAGELSILGLCLPL